MIGSAGINSAWPNALSADASGNVYCAGQFNGDSCVWGSVTITCSSGYEPDVFVAKFKDGTAGVPQLNTNNDILIYPNPAEGQILITASESLKTINIINTLGQQVYSSNVNDKKLQLDISAWPVGLYFVRINNEQTLKFIKE